MDNQSSLRRTRWWWHGTARRREAGYAYAIKFNDSVTIDWQFTRRKASEKFGYKRNNITRLKTWMFAETSF